MQIQKIHTYINIYIYVYIHLHTYIYIYNYTYIKKKYTHIPPNLFIHIWMYSIYIYT